MSKKLNKYSSTIISVIGVIGVVATGVTAAIGAIKAEEDIPKRNRPTKAEYIKKKWKYYIPSAVIGTITCGCILSANHISNKQKAALVSACALTAETLKEYRKAVIDRYGDDADLKIRNDLAKKNYNEESVDVPEGNDLLFYEEFSETYFNATMEQVKDAEYHFNRNFILRGYATINEFLEFLGIQENPRGDIYGWSTLAEGDYGYKWVDFYHDKVVMDDGLECYIIRYPFEPHTDYME